MPRPTKPPRLYHRKPRGKRAAVFVIRDGSNEVSTGTACRNEAEEALRQYLNNKNMIRSAERDGDLTIPEVLLHYAETHAPDTEDPARIGYAIDALVGYWGNDPVSKITKASCHAYAKYRTDGSASRGPVGNGTIRRELATLRAAVNLARLDGLTTLKPVIVLPPAPPPKEVWLTRSEVARLLRVARHRPETRHLARFILMGVYTGSRKSVILNLAYKEHANGGWVDLDNGLIYRKAAQSRATKKQAPAIRIPSKLSGHLRRWEALSNHWVIEYRGGRTGSIKTAWNTMLKEASLDKRVTPHTLRHTAITWAIQNGANPHEVCGFFGLSMETMEQVYIHHHPNFQNSVLEAMDRRARK